MSELDKGLEELRADLRASLNRPDLGHVATRARQHRMRRRTQIGAIVAVVLVSVAVPLLRSVSADERRPAYRPPDYQYQVDFADADHGYALGSDCDSAGLCSVTLLATADGGRSWQPRTLPETSGEHQNRAMYVSGPDQVVFGLSATADGIAGAEFISDDAGRTWRGWPGMRAGGTPTAIPAGASLVHICIGQTAGGGCVSGLGAVVPERGELSPTLTQPPLMRPLQAGGVPTTGGRYWAAGREATSGWWAISVTSDAGATWATTRLTVPGHPGSDVPGEPDTASGEAWSVVEQGGVMYATVRGGGSSRLLAVYRSTDRGMSWTTVTPSTEIKEMIGTPIATEDGRLIVNSGTDGTFESTDSGQTFTRSSLKLLGKVTWTRGGYLVYRPDRRWDISEDGVTWRTFTLP